MISERELRSRIDGLDAIRALRAATDTERTYLVGGAVRDLLLGKSAPDDLDIAVDGHVDALAARLGEPEATHERFGTASVQLGKTRIDLAQTRTETYAGPGSLPTVTPAGIEADLGRRDFTVNALALPLAADGSLLDPHAGRDDLAAGLLRVLHPGSFRDDPTRVLRAARYSARLEFELDPATRGLIGAVDLQTVSADRVRGELTRIAQEPTADVAIELLAEWGLPGFAADAGRRVRSGLALLEDPSWAALATRPQVLLASVSAGSALTERVAKLATARPDRASEAIDIAGNHDGIELVLARAAGAAWLDRYVAEWSRVRLEISGDDLLAAGVGQGPAVGHALRATLIAKVDGELGGRSEELAFALRAAADL